MVNYIKHKASYIFPKITIPEYKHRKSFYIILYSWIIYFTGLLLFLAYISFTKTARDAYSRTDAIIVLTGGSYRIQEGLSLFSKNMSEYLFVSGVRRRKHLSFDAYLKKEDKIKFAHKDKSKIFFDNAAETTIENALEIYHWTLENKIKSIRLVTSYYHMPRSLYLIQSLMPEVKIISNPVYHKDKSKNWWNNGVIFRVVFSEYNKLILSYFWNILGFEEVHLNREKSNAIN